MAFHPSLSDSVIVLAIIVIEIGNQERADKLYDWYEDILKQQEGGRQRLTLYPSSHASHYVE